MLRTQRVLVMTLLGLLIAVFSLPAFALDLGEARRDGILAEKRNGYVAVVKSSAEAKALADDVNTRRKGEYERISKQNGQTPDVVGRLAAQQVIQGLEPGSLYEGESGGWKKR